MEPSTWNLGSPSCLFPNCPKATLLGWGSESLRSSKSCLHTDCGHSGVAASPHRLDARWIVFFISEIPKAEFRGI